MVEGAGREKRGRENDDTEEEIQEALLLSFLSHSSVLSRGHKASKFNLGCFTTGALMKFLTLGILS